MGRVETTLSTCDHYGTPSNIWAPIVSVFGEIGLDPFTNPKSKVPAKVRWTDWGPASRLPKGLLKRDGFVTPWGGYGLVYVNGPFSVAGQYLARCATQGDEVIFLCRSNMNATYIHKYVAPARRVLFPDKRLKFEGETDSAPFHCLLGYHGERPLLFEEVAERIGGWCVPGKFVGRK